MKRNFLTAVLTLAIFISLAVTVNGNEILVWKVEPQLPYKDISYCICGEYTADSSGEKLLDTKTGKVSSNLSVCAHGGVGIEQFLYDEAKDTFLYHYVDDYGDSDTLLVIPRKSLSSSDSYYQFENRLNLFRKVDSDKIKQFTADDYGWEQIKYDFSNAYIGSKYAVAYEFTFITDFIYEYDFWDTLLGNHWEADEILAFKNKDKWGIINKDGNIIPFIFDDIITIDNGTAFAKYNGKYGILDIKNTMLAVIGTPSSWAAEQVNSAITAKLVPQNLQSDYTKATTRAEFCALAVALYENIKGEITERVAFTDTNDINVSKAAAVGVVTGVGNNRFDPNGQLTREQAAVMLARLANAIGKPFTLKPPTFMDNSSISSWAVDGVGQVQAAGIMGGVGNNRFAPSDPYTREQSIITIMRLFDYLK